MFPPPHRELAGLQVEPGLSDPKAGTERGVACPEQEDGFAFREPQMVSWLAQRPPAGKGSGSLAARCQAWD